MPPPSWSPRTAATKQPPLTAALRRATSTYVGLVASPKRGAAVVGALDVGAADGAHRHAGRPRHRRPHTRGGRAVDLRRRRRPPAATRRARPVLRRRVDHRRHRHRSGVRDARRRGRVLAAPRPRRPAVLVLRDRLPAGLRRRAGAIPGRDHGGPRVETVADAPAARSTTSTTSPTSAWRPPCSAPSALRQPLLLEGEAGVGKTEAAKALAAALDTPACAPAVLRGHHRAEALYEWNYPRQLLAIRTRRIRRRARRASDDLFTPSSSSTAHCCAPSATAARARRCC